MTVLLAAAAGGADPLAPDYVTMGVTLVVFGILLAILYTFAWGPILAGLKKREDAIFNARDEAVRVQREAEELRAKLTAEFAAANDKIKGMLDEARKDGEAVRAKAVEDGAKAAATERDRAKREIEAARDAALDDLYKQSVQLAALMSSKAVRRQLTADDHSRLIDESLAELKANRN